MKTITTEEARAATVADIEARIVEREAEKPTDKDALAVHEFGTSWLRTELLWMNAARLPFDLHEGEGLAVGLVEVETTS